MLTANRRSRLRLGSFDARKGAWNWDKKAIARRYARSWLAVDLISVSALVVGPAPKALVASVKGTL